MSEHSGEYTGRPRAGTSRMVVLGVLIAAVLVLGVYALVGTFSGKQGVPWSSTYGEETRYAMDPVRQVHRMMANSQGGGTFQWEVHYRLRAGGKAFAWNTWSGKVKPKRRSAYYDAQGREIPTRVRRLGPNQEQYRLLLPAAMKKGDLVILRGSDLHGLAREGRNWGYRYKHTYGSAAIRYHHELALPAGAEVLSVNPKPKQVIRQKGGSTLVWDRRLAAMEYFECRVRVRLPVPKPAAGGQGG